MTRNKSFFLMVATAAALLAGACSRDGLEFSVGNPPDEDDDKIEPDIPDDNTLVNSVLVLPDGWFELEGYGTVLHVEGDSVTPHYVTASTCTVGDDFDNQLSVDHARVGDVISFDLVGPVTDYRLTALTEAPRCDTGEELTITALDEAFTTHYPFFEQRELDWPAAVAQIRAATESNPSDQDAFETALAAVLVELGDGHSTLDGLDIDPDVAAFGLPAVRSLEQLQTAVDDELDQTIARVARVQADATGSVAWGWLDEDIGYLIMAAFEGISGEDDAGADREALRTALDAAIGDLAETRHLVVDVRFNGGGYEDLATLAAGYFVTTTTPGYRKWSHAQPEAFAQIVDIPPQAAHFDGNVVILTSPITASAAEAFALAMVEVADASVVGTPSFGEFSDAIDWVLPNGTELTLSMENYTDLEGANYEAVGVPVEVWAPFDKSVEAAIGRLSSEISAE